MTTPEEDLEAAIWRAMKTWQVTCPDLARFVDAVIFAAQRYAAGDSPHLAELRREVLHRDSAEQTSPSTRGGVIGTAPELNPPGSGAFPHGAGDGGATLSTEASIPDAVTCDDVELSTGEPDDCPQDGAELGTILPWQQRAIHAACTGMDRAKRLATISDIVGRAVTSSNELSYTEAAKVLGKLSGVRA